MQDEDTAARDGSSVTGEYQDRARRVHHPAEHRLGRRHLILTSITRPLTKTRVYTFNSKLYFMIMFYIKDPSDDIRLVMTTGLGVLRGPGKLGMSNKTVRGTCRRAGQCFGNS